MNDLPRQKLREIITQYGRSVYENPAYCKGLLLDTCGGAYKREVNVLVAVLEEHVVDDLLHISAGLPTELVVTRLTQRLCDNRSMEQDAARWGVESWALALGMNVGMAKAPPKKSPDKFTTDEADRQDARLKAEQAEAERRRAEVDRLAREGAERERRIKAEEEQQRKAREELRRLAQKQSQQTIVAKKNPPASPSQTAKPSTSQLDGDGNATPSSASVQPTKSSNELKQFGMFVLAVILSPILNTIVFVLLANLFFTIPQVPVDPYYPGETADALVPKGGGNVISGIAGVIMYIILPCLVGIIAVTISRQATRRDSNVSVLGTLGCFSGLLFPFVIIIGLWGASSGLWGALTHIQSNNWSLLIPIFGVVSCIAASIYGAIRLRIARSKKQP